MSLDSPKTQFEWVCRRSSHFPHYLKLWMDMDSICKPAIPEVWIRGKFSHGLVCDYCHSHNLSTSNKVDWEVDQMRSEPPKSWSYDTATVPKPEENSAQTKSSSRTCCDHHSSCCSAAQFQSRTPQGAKFSKDCCHAFVGSNFLAYYQHFLNCAVPSCYCMIENESFGQKASCGCCSGWDRPCRPRGLCRSELARTCHLSQSPAHRCAYLSSWMDFVVKFHDVYLLAAYGHSTKQNCCCCYCGSADRQTKSLNGDRVGLSFRISDCCC